MARTRLYRGGRLEDENIPREEVARHLGDPDAIVWLDLLSPTDAEIDFLGEELGLHHLAVEAAVQRHQRPAVDRY
jgi:magnesium transporter